MQNRLGRLMAIERPSYLQLITRHNPRYAALGLLTALALVVSAIVLGAGYVLLAPSLLTMFALGYGFWQEYKRVLVKPGKVESVFQDEEFLDENGKIKARFRHRDHFPVLEVYPIDPVERARTKAEVIAPYFVIFHVRFLQFLAASARACPGPMTRDPVAYTLQEAKRRKLDLTSAELDLHYLLQQANAAIIKYNKTAAILHRIKLLDFRTLTFYLIMCDVYKGMGGGCSIATLPSIMYGKRGTILLHTLDWLSLGEMAQKLFGLVQLTGHITDDKPKATLSLTLVPGNYGLQEFNPELMLGLNEAARMDGNNINPAEGCVPQFLLTREIASNLTRVSQIGTYLETRQPASTFILGAADPEHYGVFELNPTGLVDRPRYRFRGYDGTDAAAQVGYSAANHCHQNGRQDGTMIPRSDAIGCSRARGEAVQQAILAGESPEKVLAAADDQYTVQALKAENDGREKYTLTVNTANTFAVRSVDSQHGNTVHPDMLDLKQIFKEFLHLAGQYNAARNLHPYPEEHVDVALRDFMHQSGQVNTPNLASAAEDFYSELNTTLAQHQVPAQQQVSLPKSTIEAIARNAVDIITAVNSISMSARRKHRAIDAYERKLMQLLPQGHPITYRIITALASTVSLITMSGMAAAYLEGSAPLTFLNVAGRALLFGMVRELSLHMTAGISVGTAASVFAANSAFSKPELTLYGNRFVTALRNVVDEQQKTDVLQSLKMEGAYTCYVKS